MADIVLSSCCYNFVYSATSWVDLTTPGLSWEITGDTNIMDGCYTVVTGVTGTFVEFDGVADSIAGCGAGCLEYCCDENICLNIQNSTYSAYSGNYTFYASYNGKPYWTGGTGLLGYIY